MKVVRQTNINYLFNKPKTTYIKEDVVLFFEVKRTKNQKTKLIFVCKI